MKLFRVFVSGFLMPLDWSPPPSPWTDASGFSVDASGRVPPIPPPSGSARGGMGGTDCNLLRNAYKLINNIIVVYFKSLVGYLVIIGQYEDIL